MNTFAYVNPGVMSSGLLGICLSALLSGCIDLPEDDGGIVSIEVIPRVETPSADGLGRADIVVEVDEATRESRRSVTISVSSGQLGVEEGGSRQYSAQAPASGRITIPLRYGREPGPVQVEARTNEHVAVNDTLTLALRSADRVDLSTSALEITADGQSQVTLSVALSAMEPGSQPSYGAEVQLEVCCDDEGEPTDCESDQPLQVAQRLVLAPSDFGAGALETSITAAPIDSPFDPDDPEAEPLPPVTAYVVARVGAEPPQCADPEGPGEALVTLRINPR